MRLGKFLSCFALLVLFSATIAGASVSAVQSVAGNATTSVASKAVTLPSAVGAGHTIIVAWGSDTAASFSNCSDPLNGTYSSGGFRQGTNVRAGLAYKANVAAGSTTVTCSFSGGSRIAIVAVELSGIDTAAPIDFGSVSNAGSGTALSCGTTPTSNTANEYSVAAAVNGSVGTMTTSATGYSIVNRANASGSPDAGFVAGEFDGAFRTFAPTATTTNSDNWACVQASFRVALSSAPTATANTFTSSSNVVDDASIGNTAWPTPGNAAVSDDVRTSIVGTDTSNITTHFLKATGFGFNIPTGATVTGVQATFERNVTDHGGTCSDSTVKLVVSGAAAGNNRQKADGTGIVRVWNPTTDRNDAIGGSNDTWGQTLTPTQVNASNFGVALSALDVGSIDTTCAAPLNGAAPNGNPGCTTIHNTCSLNVDSISMTVYYSGVPAATPTFSPAPGGYGHAQSVVISDTTSGATIYYTTDGTTPTTSSTQYTAPISVGTNMTIKAIATAPGFLQSAVVVGTYVINGPAATPTFSPAPGAYPNSQSVTISDTTPGAVIRYTTDGTTPTSSSPIYSSAINVSQNTTIKAIASAAGFDDSTMATGIYTIAAATPTFSPVAGTYSGSQSVTISDATTGAVIHYTTDGSTPTATSPTYSTAISVTQNTTIKAIAIANNYANSAVGTAAYVIAAATPTFSPAAGAYPSVQNIAISDATTGAVIHYTTDGSTPTATSPTYSTAILVTQNTTIKAIAVSTNYGNSAVGSAAYTIAAATPTFNPAPGAYASTQNVTISDTTTGAVIHYTTDGTIPTASSTTYTGAISIGATSTIKAIAVAANYDNSAVATGQYVINGPAATPTFSPLPGSYGPPQNVTISTTTSGATLYYSTDGVDPAVGAANTAQYSSAITVDTGITLKAIATAPAYLTSAVATGQYIIGAPQLASLSATSGSYGKQLVLTGSYFGGGGAGSIVYFGTTSASVISWGNTSITVSVPQLTPATYSVTVVVNGQSSSGINFAITAPLNISPSTLALYVGQVQTLQVDNPDGTGASGVTFTTDNSAIATVSQNQAGQFQVQATGLGTVTLRASNGIRDAQLIVNVYSATATAPPDGTIQWSIDPLGSNSINDYFRAATTPGGPALYSVERNFNGGAHPDTIRTFNSDGTRIATHVLSGTNEVVSSRLALPDGGALLRTTWLFVGSPFQQYWVKVDGSGNEVWRFSLNNAVYGYSNFWAVNSDGILFTGRGNGSANTYEVIGFDTNTGTMKFNIPVPMGVYQNNSKPSLVSVPSILPDGNAYYPMVTRNDVLSNPDPNHGQYSVSESLNLFSVSPTGQTQTIHLIDNSCTSLRTDGLYYFDCYEINPNEVVPTSEGGQIITWSEFRGSSFCSPPQCPATIQNHFVTVPQGGTASDHILATTNRSELAVGTIALGNGVVYQALPSAVVAADYNSGQQLWNYDASATGQPSLKLSAVTDTGANELLVMEQQANVLPASYYSLFTLDAAGNKTYLPWLSPNGGSGDLFGSLLSPEIADDSSYYGILAGGVSKIVSVAASHPSEVFGMWDAPGSPDKDKPQSREATPKFEVKYNDNQCSGFDDPTVNKTTEYWLMVPATGQNTVKVKVNGALGNVDFLSSDPSVTVTPAHPTNKDTTLTVSTTVAVSSSDFYIRAIHHPLPTESNEFGRLKLSIKPQLIKTVDMFVITDNVNNLVPAESGIPSQTQLQSYVDITWKKQANVIFQVAGRTNRSVHWDILPTAAGDSYMNDWRSGQTAEINAIDDAIYPPSGPADMSHQTLTYINAFIPSLNVNGLTGNKVPQSWIATTSSTPDITAAHELGHELGAFDTAPSADPKHPDAIINPKFQGSLMWVQTGQEGCRLRKFEWDTVNP